MIGWGTRIAFVACVLALSACSQEVRGGEAVKTEAYILIDLSKTWYNHASSARNDRLISTVGHGVALMASEVDTPYSIEYRAIGDNSYLREPLCDVEFTPGFRRRDDEKTVVHRRQDLLTYLNGPNCLQRVLSRPPEPLTQISAAVASVALEPKPAPNSHRYIIVLSDFLEESKSPAPIPAGSLVGTKILLLYRPLTEDQQSPAGTSQRVEGWRALLAERGATVEISPDTAVKPSVLVSFMQHD